MISHLKKFTGIIFLLLVSSSAISQEQSVFKQYYLTPFIVNPAFTGAEIYPGAILSVKKQWLGIPDAPTTYLLSANYRIGTYDFYDPKGFVNKGSLKLKDRTGVGAAFYQDSNGPAQQTGGNISYGYHSPVNANSELSFGISITATYYSFRSVLLKPDQPDDPYLMNGNDALFKMNFNIGALYHNENNFIGLSVAKIMPDVKDVNYHSDLHPSYFLIAGHKFSINSKLMFEPALVVMKTGEDPVSADVFGKLYLNNVNWIALSYSTTGKVDILTSIHLIQMLSIGYSYEFNVSKIIAYNYGTHSLYLGINIGLFGIDGIRRTVLRKV